MPSAQPKLKFDSTSSAQTLTPQQAQSALSAASPAPFAAGAVATSQPATSVAPDFGGNVVNAIKATARNPESTLSQLDTLLPTDMDMQRREAVRSFIAQTLIDYPQLDDSARDYFVNQYRSYLSAPPKTFDQTVPYATLTQLKAIPDLYNQAKSQYDQRSPSNLGTILMNARREVSGNATDMGNPALSAALGFFFGGPLGAVGNALVDQYTQPFVNEVLPQGTPGAIKTAVGIAPGFLLPGKAFGGNLTAVQRAGGLAGATGAVEANRALGGNDLTGLVAGIAGGMVGGAAAGAAMDAVHNYQQGYSIDANGVITLNARSFNVRYDAKGDIITDTPPAPEPAGINLESIFAYQDAVEYGHVTGKVDPRAIEVMRRTLYNGDLGKVSIKETVQNAVDAIRAKGRGGGSVQINYSTQDRTLEIIDDGVGMGPSVIQHEYIDIGGSLKPEGASGGFGIAKVAIFGNADGMELTTTAKVGREWVTTRITGDPSQWISKGMTTETTRSSEAKPTGTSLRLHFKDDVQLSSGQASQWVEGLVSRSRLSDIKFTALMNGRAVGQNPPAYDPISHLTFEGGTADVYANKATREAEAYNVHVLNNGLYQYTQPQYVSNGIYPHDVVVDIKSTEPIESGNYPFQPSREGLREAAGTALIQYFHGEFSFAAVKSYVGVMQQAFKDGPLTPDHMTRVVDLTGQHDPAYLADIAQRTYLTSIAPKITEYYAKFLKSLSVILPQLDRSEFHGWGLGKFRGMHVYSRGLYADLPRDAVHPPNPMLINPYEEMKSALLHANAKGIGGDHTALKNELAGQIAATIVHEAAHAYREGQGGGEGGHTQAFALAYTELVAQNASQIKSLVTALNYLISDEQLKQWMDHTNEYQHQVDNFGDAERNIVQRTSSEFRNWEPRGDDGDIGLDGWIRSGLEGGVPSGGSDLPQDAAQAAATDTQRGDAAPVIDRPSARPPEVTRLVDLPDAVQREWRESIERIRNSTGAYPPGDPPELAAITGGGGHLGNNTLGAHAATLDHGLAEGGIESFVSPMAIEVDFPEPRETGGLKSRFAPMEGHDSTVTGWRVGTVELRLNRDDSTSKLYHIILENRTTTEMANRRGEYSWTGRQPEGADFKSLVQLKSIITDLVVNNPDAMFVAEPSDARRRAIYTHVGFRALTDAEITSILAPNRAADLEFLQGSKGQYLEEVTRENYGGPSTLMLPSIFDTERVVGMPADSYTVNYLKDNLNYALQYSGMDTRDSFSTLKNTIILDREKFRYDTGLLPDRPFSMQDAINMSDDELYRLLEGYQLREDNQPLTGGYIPPTAAGGGAGRGNTPPPPRPPSGFFQPHGGDLTPGLPSNELLPGTAPVHRTYTSALVPAAQAGAQANPPFTELVGINAAKPKQRLWTGQSLLSKFFGSTRNYASETVMHANDFTHKLRRDGAAWAAYQRLQSSGEAWAVYRAFITGDVGPLPPVLRGYVSEAIQYRDSIEARDLQHNPALKDHWLRPNTTQLVPPAGTTALGERMPNDAADAEYMQQHADPQVLEEVDISDYLPVMLKTPAGGFNKHFARMTGRSEPGLKEFFQRNRNRVIDAVDPEGQLTNANGTPQVRFATDWNESFTDTQGKVHHARPANMMDYIDSFGLEPATDNIFELMAARDIAGFKRIQKDILLDRLINWGIATRVTKPVNLALDNGPHSHEVDVSGTPMEVAKVAGLDWKLIPGTDLAHGYAMPRELAALFNDAFDANGADFYRRAIHAGVHPFIQLKLFSFTFSLFQHLDILTRGAANQVQEFTRTGNPLALAKVVPLWMEGIGASFAPPMREHIQRQWVDDPFLSEVVRQGGNVMAVQDFARTAMQGLSRDLTRFPFIGGLADANIGPLQVPFRALNAFTAYMNEGLFNGLYPVVAKRMAFDMKASIEHRRLEWSPQQVAQAVADQLNTVLSSIENWQSVIRNEGVRDIGKFLLVSLNEQEGMMRTYTRGLGGLVDAAAWSVGRGETPGGGADRVGRSPAAMAASDYNTRLVIGHLFALFIIANVINYAVTGQILGAEQMSPIRFDGKWPKFNAKFFRPVIGHTDTNVPIYLDLFGQLDTPYRWVADPATTLTNRLTPATKFLSGTMAAMMTQLIDGSGTRAAYQAALAHAKRHALEPLTPFGLSNFRDARDLGTAAEVGSFVGANINAGSLADLRNVESFARYQVAYDDLSSPIQRELIDNLPNVKAEKLKQQQYFADRGDNYSTVIQSARSKITDQLNTYETFYKRGGYITNPSEPLLPDKMHDLAMRQLGQRDVIEDAFTKVLQGFKKDQVDKDLDTYYNLQTTTEGGSVNWQDTTVRRESFIQGLETSRARDLSEMLDVIEGRRTPLQQQFRADMKELDAMSYPFGTRATQAFQTAHPEADLIMWRWFGSGLNSTTAIDSALAQMAQYPMPVKLSGFAHRVDNDQAFWQQSRTALTSYLAATTEIRRAAVDQLPWLDAMLVYWGGSATLNSAQAAQYFTQYMGKAPAAQQWTAIARDVTGFLQLPVNDKDRLREQAFKQYPWVEAEFAYYNFIQYGRDPVFTSVAARDYYTHYSGVDSSRFPVLAR